ncbi:hypothetical protein NDU88_010881 [Pleurodeles waltl]|uniref:Uncharacterized protein n=1 Tax=Pleurodeles waltl TaxID=8319 RepID=A0AAV7Q1H1_PLEWA|nr:hypothetical protein NDU88_010881 [Pleurodeles waltl]
MCDGASSAEDSPLYPGVRSRVRKAPGSLLEIGFLTQKHFWPFPAGRGKMQRRGFLRRPHRQGSWQQPVEEDASGSPDGEDNAQEKDHCRLLTQGTRRKHRAKAHHAPKSAATLATGQEGR